MAIGLGFGMAQRTSIIAAVVPSSEIGIATILMELKAQIDAYHTVFIVGALIMFVSSILAVVTLNIKELNKDMDTEMVVLD